MSLDALRRALKPPKPIPQETSNERWISWEEYQWIAVNEFFDSVARKNGRRPNPKIWRQETAGHVKRLQQAKLDDDVLI